MTPVEKAINDWYRGSTASIGTKDYESLLAAIDAATKPLREEVERLKIVREGTKQQIEQMKVGLRRKQEHLRHARQDNRKSHEFIKITLQRADQAEARNKALVGALRAAVLELQTVGAGHGHTYSAVVIEKARAALVGDKCFRPGKCKQPRNHEGPCDDWIAEAKESLPKASEGA